MKQKLSIIDVGANGDGVAKLGNGESVFIPHAMTGDVVEAETFIDKKIHRGKILNILEKSPSRVVAPCQHFGVCGGCSLQHMGDEFYKNFKRHHVLDALAKNNIKTPDNIKQIHIPHATRRRANFACMSTRDGVVMGFHERKSSNILNVPDCLLITDDVRRVMEGFRAYLPMLAGQGQKMDVLIQCADGLCEIGLTGKILEGWEAQQALSEAMSVIGLTRISIRARDYEPYKILMAEKSFIKKFGLLSLNLAAGAFLQPSDEGERALVDCVVDGVGNSARIADLFCGNGTFTGALMGAGKELLAIDSAKECIDELQKAGVQARTQNLFKNLVKEDELSIFDCVVLDPPRAGAGEQVGELSLSSVPKIVYVSCNPQGFFRDGAVLQSAGYKLTKLTIIDQFIWSPHTEVVGVWERA